MGIELPVATRHHHDMTEKLLKATLNQNKQTNTENSLSFEPHCDKTNKMACAPSENSDQPGHSPHLIRLIAVHLMGSQGPRLSSSGQRRLRSDGADAQADLSLRWAHMPFCWFCHYAAHLLYNC